VAFVQLAQKTTLIFATFSQKCIYPIENVSKTWYIITIKENVSEALISIRKRFYKKRSRYGSLNIQERDKA